MSEDRAHVEALALRHYRRQQRVARRTADQVQELWRLLDPGDLSTSYRVSVGPRVAAAVSAGQLNAAEGADDYVDAVVAAQGATSDRAGRAQPRAFAGLAADGRALEDLLYLPIISSKQRIAAGVPVQDALMAGLRQALMYSTSEVTEAGRGAVGSSMVGQRTIQGYVRVVNPPACARCIILAGKEYGWNKGFQRHPRCDCVHLPVTLIARNQHRGFINPQSYFNSLAKAEQDRVFTAAGARAIREGGDIYAIVNARRGMYTTTAYGRRVAATREGTTKRGSFFRQERNRAVSRGLTTPTNFQLRTPRLLPEEIFRLAQSRDEAIAMLRRFGYLF